MNYLAHAYLSFNRPPVLLGNMISDFIKGKKKYNYPADILYGINLHRAIDEFTDNHPVTKSAKQIFQADYGLYSGAFMDIVYDYFIANDEALFHPLSLETFSSRVYDTLETYTSFFPHRFSQLFPSMKTHNWLYNYKHELGIKRSFEGLVYRAAYMSDSSTAFNLFLENKESFASAYASFFPELVHYTHDAIRRDGL